MVRAALEAGNSERIIDAHYLHIPTEAEAREYFAILPAKGGAVCSKCGLACRRQPALLPVFMNTAIHRPADAIRAKRRNRWRAFGSVLNLGGSLRHRPAPVSDCDALRGDVLAVGQDFAAAMQRFADGRPSASMPCRNKE